MEEEQLEGLENVEHTGKKRKADKSLWARNITKWQE